MRLPTRADAATPIPNGSAGSSGSSEGDDRQADAIDGDGVALVAVAEQGGRRGQADGQGGASCFIEWVEGSDDYEGCKLIHELSVSERGQDEIG